jgi:hypothetical protein
MSTPSVVAILRATRLWSAAMTETMIPQRTQVCDVRAIASGLPAQHEPGRNTVESEESATLEWQFGTCMHCAQRISRFRRLSGGTWFDRWGNVPESVYTVPSDVR